MGMDTLKNQHLLLFYHLLAAGEQFSDNVVTAEEPKQTPMLFNIVESLFRSTASYLKEIGAKCSFRVGENLPDK